jgi:hypothetical protein
METATLCSMAYCPRIVIQRPQFSRKTMDNGVGQKFKPIVIIQKQNRRRLPSPHMYKTCLCRSPTFSISKSGSRLQSISSQLRCYTRTYQLTFQKYRILSSGFRELWSNERRPSDFTTCCTAELHIALRTCHWLGQLYYSVSLETSDDF